MTIARTAQATRVLGERDDRRRRRGWCLGGGREPDERARGDEPARDGVREDGAQRADDLARPLGREAGGLQVAHEPLDVVPADRARVVQAELGREHVRE